MSDWILILFFQMPKVMASNAKDSSAKKKNARDSRLDLDGDAE